jgi:PAS domain S-box-containing protein
MKPASKGKFKAKKPLAQPKKKDNKIDALRVLILEDNPADAELMERQLRRDKIAFLAQRAETRGGFIKALKKFQPEVVMADYTLPHFDAMEALKLARERFPYIPFIVVTGSIGEERAVSCLRAGADDYLLKDRLSRLGEAIRHSMGNRRLQSEKKAAEETLQESEESFKDIFQMVKEGIAYTTLSGKVISINSALEQILQIPREEIVGKNILYLTTKLLSKENIKKTVPILKKLIRRKAGDDFQVEYKNKILEIKTTLNRKTKRLTGVIRDVTERKRYEAALQAAAARWRTTFDSMNDTVCLLDEKGAIRQCNRAMNRLLGLPYNQIIGKDCLTLICGTRKKATCAFRSLMKDGKRHEEETFWRERWFHVAVDPIIDADGQPLGAVHIMTDITRQKEAEKALRESEAYFRLLFENSVMGISQALPDGSLLRVNLAYAKMYGYANPKEMLAEVTDIGRQLYSDPKERMKVLAILKAKGAMAPAEFQVRRRDGTPFVVLAGAREIRDADGRLICYQAEHVDVTPMKRAEAALLEMSEIFRLFLKHNPIYVFIKDENIRPIYLSDNYEKMLGRPVSELLGKSMDELFPSELSRTMVEDDKRILQEGKPCEFIEELNGRIYSTLKFPIFIQGKAKYLAGYTTDITERKQAQELLLAASRRLELALHSAKAGTWDWNVATGRIEWSPQMFGLFGLDPRKNGASFETWRKVLYPEDRELAEKRIDQALKQHTTLDNDYRVVLPGGIIRYINAVGIGVYDDAGRPIQMIGICQDISERKKSENTLRESEERFRKVFEESPIGMVLTSRDLRFFSTNPAFCQMLGYTAEEMSRKTFLDVTHPGHREIDKENVEKLWQGKIPRYRTEKRYIAKNGDIRWGNLSTSLIIGQNGKPLYALAIVEDITERKQAETALKESEERFRMQYHGNPIAAITWQKQGDSFVLKEYNAIAEKITHGRVKELIKKNANDLYGNRPDVTRAFRHCFDNQSIVSMETTSEHFLPGKLVSTTYAYIPPDLVMVHLEDVTERRQAEDKIRASEEKFRSIVENSSDQIFMLNKDCKILSMNRTGAELFGKLPPEMIGKPLLELFPENIATQFSQNIKTVFSTGKTMIEEEKILIKGQELYLSTVLNPVKDDGGGVTAVIGIVRDITNRRQAEEQVQASLNEKEVLLKEIHHRVKNNLQVISGLLTLQAAQINDERLQRIIKNSQSRIWTMALIHQTLYQSGNLAAIVMDEYIRSLAGNLLSSHAQVAMPPTVRFDLQPLQLSVDKAIPLALIINELVTNAMKHAFPNGRLGEIRIALNERRDTSRLVHTDTGHSLTYELTVADDGVGLPAGFDPESQKSLGLQLVSMLTKQLGGSLAIESKGGASVHISFANDEKIKTQS